METPKEYYYTYYSYEEWGRGYFGSRKCYCLPEEDVKYFGSSKDKNFKPTQKIILKDDYATREEAYADEIILQQYYKAVENSHFANRAYQTSTKFCVTREQAKENGKKSKELKLGFFSFTKEQRIEVANKTKDLKVGVHGLTTEELREQGYRVKKQKLGIFGLTEDQKRKNAIKGGKAAAKIINSQRWECLETGYVSTAAGVVSYQIARGIDSSKINRKRIH